MLIAEVPLSQSSARYRLGRLANIQFNIHFDRVFVLAQRPLIIYIYVPCISAFVCQILSVVPRSIVRNTGSSFPFKHWLGCIVFWEGCWESTDLIQVFCTGEIVVNKITVLYQGVVTQLCILKPTFTVFFFFYNFYNDSLGGYAVWYSNPDGAEIFRTLPAGQNAHLAPCKMGTW